MSRSARGPRAGKRLAASCALLLLLTGAAPADPRALLEQGDALLARGDRDGARAAFDAAHRAEEVNAYTAFAGRPEQRALVEARLGEGPAAARLWDEALEQNPARALLFASLYAEGEERQRLIAAARARLEGLAAELEAGRRARLFVTSKGEPRHVEPMSSAAALARIERGEPVSFAYVKELDLSGRTFTRPISLRRCVIGRLIARGADLPDLDVSDSVVLGELALGKGWEGEVNRSRTLPASHLRSVQAFGAVFLGPVSFEGVTFEGRLQSFPFTTFLGGLDLRATVFRGTAELRYASFDGLADLRGVRFEGTTYLGFARFEKGLLLERSKLPRSRLFLNSARLRDARFDASEWLLGATFEDATFEGVTRLARLVVRGPLSLTRTRVRGPLEIVESDLEDVDLLGTRVEAPLRLETSRVRGDLRLALDPASRRRFGAEPERLEAVYKLYRGDEDAEREVNPGPRYGVAGPEDLVASFDGPLSLAGSSVQGALEAGGVAVKGDADLTGLRVATSARLDGASFGGFTDLSSSSVHELSLRDVSFLGSLSLDDASVPGRLVLSGSRFDRDVSLLGASIGTLKVDRAQVEERLLGERCAADPGGWDGDRRLPGELRAVTCHERAVDEYAQLQEAFESDARPGDADWAYYRMRHHGNWAKVADPREGPGTRVASVLAWVFFEKAFGWGVHLGNILVTAMLIALLFALLYRSLCPDSRIQYDGEDVAIRDLPFHALLIVSLQSLMAVNVGWDGGATDRAFKNLNTAETVVGLLLLTFFVGAYTRMVLS